MLFAQSLLFLAAILAFAPLCKMRWYAGAAVLGYGVYMAALSVAYRELRVDGMLTVLTAVCGPSPRRCAMSPSAPWRRRCRCCAFWPS